MLSLNGAGTRCPVYSIAREGRGGVCRRERRRPARSYVVSSQFVARRTANRVISIVREHEKLNAVG